MTYTIKRETIGDYSVSICQDKFSSGYRVEVLKLYSDGSGLARREKEHNFTSLKSAKSKYNQYIKYYKA